MDVLGKVDNYITLSTLYKLENFFEEKISRDALHGYLNTYFDDEFENGIDALINSGFAVEENGGLEIDQSVFKEDFGQKIQEKNIPISPELLNEGWYETNQRPLSRVTCKPFLENVAVRSKNLDVVKKATAFFTELRLGLPFFKEPSKNVRLSDAPVKIVPIAHRFAGNTEIINTTIRQAKTRHNLVVIVFQCPGVSFGAHVLGASLTPHVLLGSEVLLRMYSQIDHISVRRSDDGFIELSSQIEYLVSAMDDISSILLASLEGEVVVVPAGYPTWRMGSACLLEYQKAIDRANSITRQYQGIVETIYGEKGKNCGKEEANHLMAEFFGNIRNMMRMCDDTNKSIEHQLLSRLMDAYSLFGDDCVYIVICGAIHADQIQMKINDGFSYVPPIAEKLLLKPDYKLRAKMVLLGYNITIPRYPPQTYIKLYDLEAEELSKYVQKTCTCSRATMKRETLTKLTRDVLTFGSPSHMRPEQMVLA